MFVVLYQKRYSILTRLFWHLSDFPRPVWPTLQCQGDRRRVARPHSDTAPLIGRQALALNEFILQSFQGRVLELELLLESSRGQAAASLEHGHRLVENLLKGHRLPSLCRCGVQQTVWEWER